MLISLVRERAPEETRVGLVPDAVAKLAAAGHRVLVEPGAGERADFGDPEYVQAGAELADDGPERADLTVSVRPLTGDTVARLRRGTATVSFLPAAQSLELVRQLAGAGITSFALELVPRISRAQAMDAMSSQALVAGYRCAIIAADMLPRMFPLNMTAAGTLQPAQVLVLGAGVAGLQAIATCRRLGAVVRAYDVRAAAAEEIASVGGKPIELDLETLEGSGGYAREMTADRARRQQELLEPYIAAADVLITTAAVPGRQAPRLVTADNVRRMKAGSVVIDLAAETGGNVEGSVPGETVRIGRARVWGGRNVPGQLPGPASRLLAQNIVNLLGLLTGPEGRFSADFADEIVAGACVTHDGQVRHEPTKALLQGPLDAERPA
ncbi:NAD(P) transhydrogenase subunit alpha [Arthrobacter mobilis]|uniref:proton-translocating NAD(P)(+) transhydrogenase n=1 Tax=Arthrobacter mobilis TaxID=2724944 RepID=A0A7X6HC41_9MICC|nr:NAD(P) transhydrogenase subunit alpha [Arthrobacter mobilis]NKX54241.1 NAD(P) transhydrogenase subunit alpha [Arthrobacter mobilis]